jgi:citrate synthase
MKLSVIIPAHNNAAHLPRCLDALAHSTRAPDEIIVVDDASRDGSARIARACARVIVLDGAPRGPAFARNRGAAIASGDALVFLDADVAAHPDALARIESALIENANVAALFGSYDAHPPARSWVSLFKNLLHHHTHQHAQREAFTFWAGCGAIRRAVFLALGGFDERYARPSVEDIELGARLLGVGYRVQLCPEIQVTHLKQWSLKSLLISDIRDRAIPWSRLIAAGDAIPADLNLDFKSRVSAVAAWIIATCSLLMLIWLPAGFIAALALAILCIANRGLYRLFAERGGIRFMIAALALHWLYFLYSSAVFAIVVMMTRFSVVDKSFRAGYNQIATHQDEGVLMPSTALAAAPEIAKGLEGIVAAATQLSEVHGQIGKLTYRGYDINDLAAHSTFEETVDLLWYGVLPTRELLEKLTRKFIAARPLPHEVLEGMELFPKHAATMDVLRTVVSLLGLHDPDGASNSVSANVRKSIRLTAQMPTITAAWHNISQGRKPILPRADLSHAANFLYMLNGKVPSEKEARILDIALILHMDHGLNASTFVARSIASTESDMYSAISGALGALKGPLHGGANEAVMQMLMRLGDVSKVEPFVKAELAAHRKISGFGHRIYKTTDPRAEQLRRIALELAEATGNRKWIDMSEKMREVMARERPDIYVNVDFYSASVYYTLGIPSDLFTPIFAISRVAGWTAHVMEQLMDNRIMRPESAYVGPKDQKYIPIDQRQAAAT